MDKKQRFVQEVRELIKKFPKKRESLFIYGEIPEKKLNNARDKAQTTPTEEVLVLMDETAFGSANDSTLITTWGIRHKYFGSVYGVPWEKFRNGFELTKKFMECRLDVHGHTDFGIYTGISKVSIEELKSMFELGKKIFADGSTDSSEQPYKVDRHSHENNAAIPPQLDPAIWFIGVDGEQQGPFTKAGLAEKVILGKITRQTDVWKNGMAGWAKAGTVSEFGDIFSNTPPPLPSLPPSEPEVVSPPLSLEPNTYVTFEMLEFLEEMFPVDSIPEEYQGMGTEEVFQDGKTHLYNDERYREIFTMLSGRERKEAFISLLKTLANEGYIFAQVFIGLLYRGGISLKQDYTEAIKWIRKAAERGSVCAQITLYGIYSAGKAIEEDYVEATKWARKAAEQGNVKAQLLLGGLYVRGEGVEQDFAEGVKWFRKAAEQGNADAQCGLSMCYYEGAGVKQDIPEAVKWLRKAAEQGNADAQLEFGRLYVKGEGVEQDFVKATKWLRKAAEQGNSDAQCDLGLYYYAGKGIKQDFAEGLKWFLKAAEQENAVAQYCLGMCYYEGTGVKQDIPEAAKWLCKALEQEDEDAEKLFEDNIAAPLELEMYDETMPLLMAFAKEGYARAQYLLGECYNYGNGVDEDEEEAVKWYRKAAEQGHEDAQCELDEY